MLTVSLVEEHSTSLRLTKKIGDKDHDSLADFVAGVALRDTYCNRLLDEQASDYRRPKKKHDDNVSA